MMRDRGTKKWTSMMLPEHAKELDKLFATYEQKEKPILDDQQLMENETLLQEAIEHELDVEIKYFKGHDFHTAKGKVNFISAQNRYLEIDNNEVKLNDIIEVSL